MVGNPSASGISMISVRGQHKELNTARPINEMMNNLVERDFERQLVEK
jgi:hypothetical protein